MSVEKFIQLFRSRINVATQKISLLLLIFMPIPAMSYPAGGYTESCRDISVNGTSLTATCKDIAGNWASQSTILNYARCGEYIFNQNGVLKCQPDKRSPEGTYRSTCTDIQLDDDDILFAICKKIDGSRAISKLQISACRGNISNIDGHLSCDAAGPAGSYTQTCWNIRNEAGSLKAICRTRNGDMVETEMKGSALYDCTTKKGELTNNDGHLQCYVHNSYPGSPGGVPPCQPGNPSGTANCGVQFSIPSQFPSSSPSIYEPKFKITTVNERVNSLQK